MQHLQRNQIHRNFQILLLQDIYKHLQHHSGRILNNWIILSVSSQAKPIRNSDLLDGKSTDPLSGHPWLTIKIELTSKTFDGIITQVNGFQIREFR